MITTNGSSCSWLDGGGSKLPTSLRQPPERIDYGSKPASLASDLRSASCLMPSNRDDLWMDLISATERLLAPKTEN
jgi:hypothetical protein